MSGVNALFRLDCGCVLDGCHDSGPGRAWAEGRQNGALQCAEHGWQRLMDVVALEAPDVVRRAGSGTP